MTGRIAFQGEPGAYMHQACRQSRPAMEALPPLRVEAERACPAVMPLAVGQVVTLDVALLTVCGSALEVLAA